MKDDKAESTAEELLWPAMCLTSELLSLQDAQTARKMMAKRVKKAEKGIVYNGQKRKLVTLLSIFILLALALSIERTVIDVLGQMWGTLLINCAAIVCSIAGLLGLCARDIVVVTMYMLWNVLSIGLNVLVIFIYHNIGLMAKKEHYLGILVGNDNYWKGHGIQCMLAPGNGSFVDASDYGDEIPMNDDDSGSELLVELDPNACLISYTLIETVHAAIYMFFAIMIFILCSCLVFYPRRKNPMTDYSSDEEFSYVSVAQRYDYPERQANQHRRQSALGFW